MLDFVKRILNEFKTFAIMTSNLLYLFINCE